MCMGGGGGLWSHTSVKPNKTGQDPKNGGNDKTEYSSLVVILGRSQGRQYGRTYHMLCIALSEARCAELSHLVFSLSHVHFLLFARS